MAKDKIGFLLKKQYIFRSAFMKNIYKITYPNGKIYKRINWNSLDFDLDISKINW